MTTNSSTSSPIDRAAALAILKAACNATAHHDYAHKFTENEEDLRACIYHRVRSALDNDECWRVFLSYSTLHAGPDIAWRKPDLVFLRGQPVHTNVSLEILLELKNWPTLDQIRHDLHKLVQLRARFPKDKPHLVFFGIGRGLEQLKPSIDAEFEGESDIDVLLYDHDPIYKGPWLADERTDPYRKKLRMIEAVSNEAAT